MTLTGNKVTKYQVFDCPACHKSFEIEFTKLINEADENGIVGLMCPHCEIEWAECLIPPTNYCGEFGHYVYRREV